MDDYCDKREGYPSDCELTEGLRRRAMARSREELDEPGRSYAWKSCLKRASRIKLLLLDVDGVLTDSRIVYGVEGGELKSFSTRDGFGLRLLREAGVEAGIITARSSGAVQRRAEELKLAHVYQGAGRKVDAFNQILASTALAPEEVAYMGDDWIDLPVLARVGLAAAPADAVREVRESVHYVTIKPAGLGAVRELCELIVSGLGQWERLLTAYREGLY